MVELNKKQKDGFGQVWLTIACVFAYGLGSAVTCAVTTDVPVGMVSKVVEPFNQALWFNSQWNSGLGKVFSSNHGEPGLGTNAWVNFQAKYSGDGFEVVKIMPPTPLVIPGRLQSVMVHVRRDDKRYGLAVAFTDGWGRETGNDHKPIQWDIPLKDTDTWQVCTFNIPQNWVQPVSINGIFTHNWETRQLSNTVTFGLGPIDVVTDLHQADPVTGTLETWCPELAKPGEAIREAPDTPLVDVRFIVDEDGVFAGDIPRVECQIRNWKSGILTGRATYRVVDDAGKIVTTQNLNISVDSVASYVLPLTVKKYGRYVFKASLSLSDGTECRRDAVFAVLPPVKELTADEKMASPYGLNVHSAERIVIDPFKKAGILWFREYAFNWDWILRAKGKDRQYAGWPYYDKIVQSYRDAGVNILPVIQGSLKAPEVESGKVVRIGPDEAWTREMASLMLAFPDVTHWELSNEYDLSSAAKVEQLCDWANYRAYHRQFSDILSIIGGPTKVAVENGRAGIWPKRVKNCISSGDFEKIGVVNSHHYCGTDAPEMNYENYNMGFDASEQQLGCFYDLLRAVKQAAQADGRKRESWLTEFGWDTLAGPVVSPYEQAVFLPRAWMLAMAAGTDKAFWFYNFDAPNPKAFFDGCGLLGADGAPKLSLCSLAGMTSILRAPHFVGSLNAGDNTWGYVFESEGKRIASLWTIKGDNGPLEHFKAEQLYDYLGNKLPGDTVRLSMAPVYAVGLDRSDIWWKQTAYSLKTPLLVGASAGDIVCSILTINNNRSEPINSKISLVLPEGWKAARQDVPIFVKTGDTVDIEIPFTVGAMESQGIKNAKIIISEGRPLKEIPFRVMVQPAVAMQADAIVGPPGPASSIIQLANLSSRSQDATLHIKTPASWKVATPTVEVKGLKPGEKRKIEVNIDWSPEWEPQESATVELDAGLGKPLIQPLIPNEYHICSTGKIKLDGDLGEWPAKTELPNWILGSTLGTAQARVYLSWSPEGLFGAVEVHDSRVVVNDPGNFWTCDALELYLDTRDDKRPRNYVTGDHQFWFVPLIDQNRVYVGQWKRAAELSESQFDIQGIQSAANKTSDGYVMEFLLPAALIKNYHPIAGSKIGVNVNLVVQGRQSNREVYWPNPKKSGSSVHPETWGTMDLVN
jgi:hypothetical protein